MVGGSRRQALVEAAFARIAHGGLEGLRLRQVADDVGIDHSTLHHHVATKQELILEVAAYMTRQQWTPEAWEHPDPAQGLHLHLLAIRQRLVEQPELFTVSAELELRGVRDPAVAQALVDLQQGWRDRLVELFERGLAVGVWQDIDVDTTAELVIATAKGLRQAPHQAPAVLAHLEALMGRKHEGEPCTS